MRHRLWIVAVSVGLGLGVLALASGPIMASGCDPACAPGWRCVGGHCVVDDCECEGDFGCPFGQTCDGCHCSGSSSCGGYCTAMYQGHLIGPNNCAYNGGSGACWCPLPGTPVINQCN
jgi:hypothetical protein